MDARQLIDQLHNLNRAEKFRIVQFLVTELAQEEVPIKSLLQPGAEYEIWSPYESFDATEKLTIMLERYGG